ncbi:hypothetical protein [Solidesulfovibrio sp.]|uniref:hypothetical protein n=1 Tax=Solidesulfovibrio sp. TaxID=2910990 RepID=UPI00344B8CD6
MQSIAISTLILLFLSLSACTRMTPTQQGALSGAAIGAGAGVGISALAGGNLGVGALVGGALGGVAGGLYGNEQEQRDRAAQNVRNQDKANSIKKHQRDMRKRQINQFNKQENNSAKNY